MRIVAIDPTVPFWLEGRGPRSPGLSRDVTVDAAVIGGGVTGLACARLLARAGLRVHVLEARFLVSGASGRNGGFLLRGFARPYASVRDAALMRLTEDAVRRVSALAGDAFRQVGSLYVAKTEDELGRARAEYEALRADGFAIGLVERGDLPGPLRRRYRGGLFHPSDGVVEPGRWGERLARAAAGAGAAISEKTRASSLDGTTVATPRAHVVAEHVVVATDGYSGGLLPEIDALVAQARNQVVATAPLGERRFELPVYARDGYDYWQQTRDSRLIVGGRRDADAEREATGTEAITAPIQRELEALVGELLGHVPEITHRWSGALAFTPDLLPLVGRVPGRENVWVALGYSGHGNALALASGEGVARAILGEPDPRLEAFNPGRFPGVRPPA